VIPDTDAPENVLSRFEFSPVPDYIQTLVKGYFAAVPQIRFLVQKIRPSGRDDLISGLPRAGPGVGDLPGKPRAGFVDSQRVFQMFAPQKFCVMYGVVHSLSLPHFKAAIGCNRFQIKITVFGAHSGFHAKPTCQNF
jgi:hypothetical protein